VFQATLLLTCANSHLFTNLFQPGWINIKHLPYSSWHWTHSERQKTQK
jgi:hypothetical protein